jgi:magnesium-transporting ATPase (P-type)
MEYEKIPKSPSPIKKILELSAYYNSGSVLSGKNVLGGNATDRALLESILPLSKHLNSYHIEHRIPFDSSYKFSYAHIKGADELFLVKGAPEKILQGCKNYMDEKGALRPFSFSIPQIIQFLELPCLTKTFIFHLNKLLLVYNNLKL